MKHLGDITKLNGAQIPVVDVITGGSPCQDLSVAGLRKGLKHEENGDDETTRSGLFMDQLRIIKEMRANEIRSGRTGIHVRPRFMVWENVVGSLSSPGKENTGKDFQAVLTEIVRVVEPNAPDVPLPPGGAWDKCGVLYGEMGNWSLAYRVHDAQFHGVPQRRRRLALVADFNGLAAPEILFDPQLRGETPDSEPDEALRDPRTECKPKLQPFGDSLRGDTEPSGAQGQGASESTGRRAAEPEKLSFQERAGKPGGARESSFRMSEQAHCQPSTTNLSSINGPEAYGISSFDSNAMKSDNPHSGFYRADTARTLDLNGGNPACNQGGGTGSIPDSGSRLPERNRKPFCERHSASEGAGDEPQQQQRSQSADPVMRGGWHVPDVSHALKAKANCDYREDSETYVCITPPRR